MKRIISWVLSLSLILSLLPAVSFAAVVEEEEPTVYTYNITTKSYNIGNDTDGDGSPDDFGDSETSLHAENIPPSMYNTWTDKNADKFIPFYSSGVTTNASGEAVDANFIRTSEDISYDGYAWARGREKLWRLYPIWKTITKNKDYFTTYDYQNLNNTAPWQWTEFNAGVATDNTYITSGQSYIVAKNETITDGREPYVTLRLSVPEAGLYDVSVNASNNGMARLYFYMLRDTGASFSRAELTSDANHIGAWDQRKVSSATFKKSFSAPAAGEYLFVIKMDNDNWGEGTTPPTQWVAYFKSITLTLNPKGTFVHFSELAHSDISGYTAQNDGWALDYNNSHSSILNSEITGYGIKLTASEIGANADFDIYAPYDGVYQLGITATHRTNGTASADVFADGSYMGSLAFNGLSDKKTEEKLLRSVYLTAGVHRLSFVPKKAYGDTATQYMTIKDLLIKMVSDLPDMADVSSETLYLAVGEKAYPEVFVKTADGFIYPMSAYTETGNQDKHIAKTFAVKSGDGYISVGSDGLITAKKAGFATVTATVTYKDGAGKTLSVIKEDILVKISSAGADPLASAFKELRLEEEGSVAPHFTIAPGRSVTYTAKAINALGNELSLAGADVSWGLSGSGKESFSLSATSGSEVTVSAASASTAKLTLTVTLDGETREKEYDLICRDIKTGRSLYTDEMVAIARENIENYSWANSIKTSAVNAAAKYLNADIDTMWNDITSQDLPRSYRVGFRRDPEEYICRFCGYDLSVKYGNYCYTVDPVNNPWKVICPECDKTFPTNDFESFYHLGRTVDNNGKFDRLTALENHRVMLVDKGLLSAEARALKAPGEDGSETWKKYYGYGVEGGYLYNETCPEVGTGASVATLSSWETVEGWGVDDGRGYVTGREYVNNVPEVYTYAAYYNHFATWFGGSSGFYLVAGVDALANAYLYTGDERYGIKGAILLDRFADVYPEMDLSDYGQQGYANNDGEARTGKAVGRIWECFPSEMLANAYDILFPMYENAEVVEYLDNKAREWGMGDAKSTPEKIKKNVEDGICVAIFDGAKAAKIQGNFGLHQASVATAAVALDRYPETQEMIDWLFRFSESDSRTYNTGGDINNKLVQILYRDGQNIESPYYNEMGISDFGDAAIALARYDGYNGMSIYENPKYLQYINSFQLMTLLRRGVKAIGDSSYAVQYADYPSVESMKEAFHYIKDNPDLRPAAVKIAQHLYLKQGSNLKNMRYDIFTRNPESLADDVCAIIEEYGEFNYDKSSILTGYGFAILRDGTLASSANENGLRDTQRDFTLNFSGHYSHNHADLLDLGMEAYGMGMTTDLGYPETPLSGDPHSAQWSQASIGHNTVVVDEVNQKAPKVVQSIHHFDSKDTKVKVMDASAADAYDDCDEYRRTLVMVDYNDDISYGIDFFRVSGGDDHLYTFQPNSEEHPTVSDNIGSKFVTQVGGSYAGADVPFGNDPNTLTGSLVYPRGYTWMYDVDRADNPGENEFWFDYQIKDFRNHSRNSAIDVRLRATILNDFEPDEVSLVSTKPQRIASNDCIEHLEKFLIRRKGTDLDSLFTTVYEPYREGARYVEDIASGVLTVSGNDGAGDVVKAVRVKIGGENPRYDYIVYATNNNVTYTVTDTERDYSFTFRGFVGVVTFNEQNKLLYSYLNDGTEIAGGEHVYSEIVGTVDDWQHELSAFNWVDVTFTDAIDKSVANDLSDRLVNFERSEPGNSAFMIEGVTPLSYEGEKVKTARLDLGTVTPISGYVDVEDESKGFTYDLFEDAAFAVALSYEDNGAPIFDVVSDISLNVGETATATVNAVSLDGLDITYAATALPSGAEFDTTSATFTWTPAIADAGTHTVEIAATDAKGRETRISFTVEVTIVPVTDITLNVTKLELQEEETASLIATVEPSNATDKNVVWETSDNTVATVENGVVTAVSIGDATITATGFGGVFAEIPVNVSKKDEGNLGKSFTYRISVDYAKAETDQHGRISDVSYVDSYDEFDFSDGTSAPWAFNNSNLPYNSLYSGFFQLEPSITQYESKPPFAALKIYVENKGEYYLSILPYQQARGVEADVYVVPAQEGATATRSLIEGKEPLGTVSFIGSGRPADPIKLSGIADIPRRGDYFVIFDFKKPSHSLQAANRHAAWLTSMTLDAVAGPFDKIELSMDGIADNTMALRTEGKLSWNITDALGEELENFNPANLVVNSVTSSDTSVATITNDGTVSALSCGVTDLTVDITYTDAAGEAIRKTATYPLTVAPAGGNLFRGILSDFEGTYVPEEWGWLTPNDPTAVGFAKGYITEDVSSPGNKIFKVELNPDAQAESLFGMEISTGFRIPVKANRFYMLTFKFKTDVEVPEGANDLWSTFDTYVYDGIYGSNRENLAFNAERSWDITTDGWLDTYSEWQTVTVPVVAPTEVREGLETVYIAPRVLFRTGDDAGKTGFSGSFYFDDFQIREVGYDSVELSVTGSTASAIAGDKLNLEIRPRTTVGTYFSMGGAWSAESVTLTSGNDAVVGNFGTPEISQWTIVSTADVMGESGSADITASVEINGITRSVTETVDLTVIVPVTGISLDKDTLTLKVGDSETLRATVTPQDATDTGVVWSTDNDSVATVDNGVVTAVGAGNATITATSVDGGLTATSEVTVEPEVEPVEYVFKQSVQIGLIEPWFLKVNLLVCAGPNETPIDNNTLLDYGAYFVRASELENPNATQDTLTVEEVLNNPNTVKKSYRDGEATVDGSLLTAQYDKGIYTYEMADSVFVLFYVEDQAGIQYAPIRERNIKNLLDSRKNSTSSSYKPLEKDVYTKMSKLEENIQIYRSGFSTINQLAQMKAPKLSEYVRENGSFSAETVKNYDFGNSVQIILIEPWGLKVNAIVRKPNSSVNINYSSLEEYGAIVFYDTEGEITSGQMSAEQLMTKSDAYVFSSKNGDSTIDGSLITALYNKGIYTYQLNSNAYVMFYVKDADGYHYGDVKVRNAYDLAKTRAADTSGKYGLLERNVYTSMVNMYDSVKAYRDDFFANN